MHAITVMQSGFKTSVFLSKPTFNFIFRCIKGAIARVDTRFRNCIPVTKWPLLFSSTAEYRVVGGLFGVSRSTVCNCVREFCKAVIDILMPKFIRIPTAVEMEGMATYFEERWGLPQCIGAIDGSHIPIMRPMAQQTTTTGRDGILLWFRPSLMARGPFGICVWGALAAPMMPGY